MPPAETRDEKRGRLQRVVAELNNTSDECMSAVAELDLMRLEDENAKLREELEALWTAATDFRRVPINAAFLATLNDKLESAHKLLLRTPKP